MSIRSVKPTIFQNDQPTIFQNDVIIRSSRTNTLTKFIFKGVLHRQILNVDNDFQPRGFFPVLASLIILQLMTVSLDHFQADKSRLEFKDCFRVPGNCI